MTIAETILAAANGAREARGEAIQAGANCYNANGMEIWYFWQDNSVLIILAGGFAVFAGKGQ